MIEQLWGAILILIPSAETVQGLDENFKEAIEVMRNTDYPVAAINSGCELFLRFITLAKLDTTVY